MWLPDMSFEKLERYLMGINPLAKKLVINYDEEGRKAAWSYIKWEIRFLGTRLKIGSYQDVFW